MKKSAEFVADSFRRVHDALLRDLDELDLATRLPAETALKALRHGLDTVHQHLKRHFRLEEGDGYMEEVRQRQPGLERPIAELESQHILLRRTVERLIKQAKKLPAASPAFREAVRHWIHQVREHGARETRLLQESFNLDIAAED